MRFQVPQPNSLIRLADMVMLPVMVLVGGFNRDKIQSTHRWHIWKHLSFEDIDQSKVCRLKGSDTSSIQGRYGFLSHIPILGGWKNYTVFNPSALSGPFRIGWALYENSELQEVAIHKLPITKGAVRMLDGPPRYSGFFFAIDEKGNQIALKKVGQGTLGDMQHTHVRLF